jgi:hypothetical protein
MGAHGWPTVDHVGREASQAAWLIAQHAISRPQVMLDAMSKMTLAMRKGEDLRINLAHLEDRIAVFRGQCQTFGTQLDWNAKGEMAPAPMDHPPFVDDRRAEMGLEPVAERLARIREEMKRDGEKPPRDLKAYFEAREAFAREVGWRD